MKTVLRILLFSLSIVLLSNCTASQKASKVTEEKAIAEDMCSCLSPIVPMMAILDKGTPEQKMEVMEELEAKGKAMETCVNDIDSRFKAKEEALGSEKFKEFKSRVKLELKEKCPATHNLIENG